MLRPFAGRPGPGAVDADRLRSAGTAAVSGAMVVFSANNVVVGSMTLSGLGTAAYRLWLGVAGLALILYATGRRPGWTALRAAVPGGIAYGAHLCLLFTAFQTTSLANATIILAMQSGLTLTVVGRLFGEAVRGADVLLTVVATTGAVTVIAGGRAGGTGDVRGDALAVLGMVGGTAYFVLAKRARAVAPAGEYQLGLLLVAAVVTVPVFVLLGENLTAPGGADALRLLSLAGGGTAGHLALNWAHRHVPLKVTSLMTLAVPVLTTALAWVILGEHLSAVQMLGAAVTLGALAAVIVRAVSGRADASGAAAAAEPSGAEQPGAEPPRG